MLFCRNKDCFGPAHSGALCPACAEDEAHSSPLIPSKEAKKRGSVMDAIRVLGDRLMGHSAEMEASFDRVEERVTALLEENATLRAENEALRRNAWGWSPGVVPLADPETTGVFFHVKPDDVVRFIRERHDSYGNTPPLTHFAYSVGKRGALRVRVLHDGNWRGVR